MEYTVHRVLLDYVVVGTKISAVPVPEISSQVSVQLMITRIHYLFLDDEETFLGPNPGKHVLRAAYSRPHYLPVLYVRSIFATGTPVLWCVSTRAATAMTRCGGGVVASLESR